MHLNFHSVFRMIIKILLIPVFLSNLSCSGNIYSEMVSKEREQALLEDAIKAINKGDYDTAISKLDKITSSLRSTPEVTRIIAAAYSGKCGLNFLDMVDRLGQTTGDSIYMMMMKAFQNRSVFPDSCYNAQLAVESIFGTNPAIRPADINLFMAILGMAKIGSNLRAVADSDGSGTTDPGFDACDAGSITDEQTVAVGTGLGLILENITAVSAAVSGGSALTELDDLRVACDLAGLNCTLTDPTDVLWDAPTILGIRATIESNSVGINSCADNPFITCCP